MTALAALLREAHERRILTGLDLRLRIRRLPQISRYAVVSMLALSVDYTAYLMLVAAGMKPTLAAVFGYPMGLVLHFALSTTFVFDISALNKARIRLFGEFALSGLAGLAATTLVVAVATEVAGLQALPAKIMATGVSFMIVYTLRRCVVFAQA